MCRASQQQNEQETGQQLLGFDRNYPSIIDVRPSNEVEVEMVSSPAQEQQPAVPAWWQFGQRLAKGAAVFALALAMVRPLTLLVRITRLHCSCMLVQGQQRWWCDMCRRVCRSLEAMLHQLLTGYMT